MRSLPHVAPSALRAEHDLVIREGNSAHVLTDGNETPTLIGVMSDKGVEVLTRNVDWTLDPYSPVPDVTPATTKEGEQG